MNILEEANKLVHDDRNASYGHPIEDFTCTAAMWTAYLKRKYGPGAPTLQPEDVGLMMVCVKLSREACVPKFDNLVDGAGYFETVAMIKDEKYRRDVIITTFGPLDKNGMPTVPAGQRKKARKR